MASAEWIVGSLLGAGAIGYWLRSIRGHWRHSKGVRDTERVIRRARADADGTCPYRILGPDDLGLLTELRATDETRAVLERAGFRMLGDLVIQHAGEAARGAVRLLVDGEGTTIAMLIVVAGQPALARLVSVNDHGGRTTLLGAQPYIATAPTSFRQTVTGSIQDLVAIHRSSLSEPMHRIASLEDALRELVAAFERTKQWRAQQSPDELLEADLRALFGTHFDRHGRRWIRRLRERLPEATLRRI